MSSEETAKHFKDQSEEQVLTWMLSNLTPEQIKDCLLDEKPELLQEKELTIEDKIRDYCSGKKYVIHKVENQIVYFWYLLGKSWKYYNKPLTDFPTEKGKDAEECGNYSDDDAPSSFDTDLQSVPHSTEFSQTLKSYKTDLSWIKSSENLKNLRQYCAGKKYVIHKIENDTVFFWFFENGAWKYYNNGNINDFPKSMDEQAKECGDDTIIKPSFIKNSYLYNKLDDSSEDSLNDFLNVKKEYEKLNINNLWIDTLLKALNIQKDSDVSDKLKPLFNYVPVLIESVTETSIYFYYLNKELEFSGKEIKITEFVNELQKINTLLNETINIIKNGEAGSSNSNTLKGYINTIKTNIKNIDSGDLNRIKMIYSQFPLSATSTFFMKDLIEESNEFGNCNSKPHSYGQSFNNRFNSKKVSNNFGATTTMYSKKGLFG